MNESNILAGFLAGLTFGDLSEAVVAKAEDLILDQLGIALGASTKPWSVGVYKYVQSLGGPAESTIAGYGDRVRADSAAFANATFGHGFEMDDTYLPANSHVGAVVVPTALALAERDLIDGRSLLLAVVAGYEAMGRVGVAIAPSCLSRGFHPTSVTGPIGAAAAASKVLGFDSELMLNAIGIASSHSSGVTEYTQTGGSLKRIHAAIAASGGIRAAFLAQTGITSPPTILEGKKGLCRAFSDTFYPEKLTSNLGKDFVVADMSYKFHCCNYFIQAALDATGKIVKEHHIKPDDIEQIIMGTCKHGVALVGTIVEPKDLTGAQFSAPFSIAMCVVKGSNGPLDYNEKNLKDPDIRELGKKVRLEVDSEIEATFPAKRGARVTIKLKDGASYAVKLEGPKGSPDNPMTRAEVQDKFRNLACAVLPTARAEEIITMTAGLRDLKNIATLCKLLVA